MGAFTTVSKSLLTHRFVTRQEPIAKTIVTKILADLISKVIDKSKKFGGKRTVERQKNYHMNGR